ncbi:hypothetical protein ACNOYE_37865 [Nannocystaceae bacterium ST9]
MADADESSIPTPTLPPLDAASGEPAMTLEQLLEHASRSAAARFGAGTLVGECLDTHNPHLPRRVLVRARDEDGVPVSAWLPVLADLGVHAGQKVLLSKPDNWPEPVVIGAIAGLERPSEPAPPAGAEPGQAPSDGSHLRLEPGQAVVICDSTGQPMLELRAGEAGPRLVLLHPDVALEAPGRLRVAAERIELRAREGGVDIRAEGDTLVRSRLIRLN